MHGKCLRCRYACNLQVPNDQGAYQYLEPIPNPVQYGSDQSYKDSMQKKCNGQSLLFGAPLLHFGCPKEMRHSNHGSCCGEPQRNCCCRLPRLMRQPPLQINQQRPIQPHDSCCCWPQPTAQLPPSSPSSAPTCCCTQPMLSVQQLQPPENRCCYSSPVIPMKRVPSQQDIRCSCTPIYEMSPQQSTAASCCCCSPRPISSHQEESMSAKNFCWQPNQTSSMSSPQSENLCMLEMDVSEQAHPPVNWWFVDTPVPGQIQALPSPSQISHRNDYVHHNHHNHNHHNDYGPQRQNGYNRHGDYIQDNHCSYDDHNIVNICRHNQSECNYVEYGRRNDGCHCNRGQRNKRDKQYISVDGRRLGSPSWHEPTVEF